MHGTVLAIDSRNGDARCSGRRSVPASDAAEQLKGGSVLRRRRLRPLPALKLGSGEEQGAAMKAQTFIEVLEVVALGRGGAGAHCAGDVLQHRTSQPCQNRLSTWQPSPMSGPAAGMFSVPECNKLLY